MALPLIPIDKANHFVYGAVISAIAQVVAVFAGFPEYCAYAGVGASAIVGALKEGVDALLNYRATGNVMQGPHGVEFNDFLATALGGTHSLMQLV